jgi:hypothetical protein
VQPPTVNSSVAALRFFFRVTLGRPEMCQHLSPTIVSCTAHYIPSRFAWVTKLRVPRNIKSPARINCGAAATILAINRGRNPELTVAMVRRQIAASALIFPPH